MADNRPEQDISIVQNRAIKRRPGGRGGSLDVLDSNRGRELARRRWDKRNKAIRDGVAAAGIQIPGVEAPNAYDVLRHVAEQHALNAADPSAPNSVASANYVTKHGWPEPDRVAEPSTAGAPGLPGGMTLAEARELLEYLRGLRAKQASVVVVDGDK